MELCCSALHQSLLEVVATAERCALNHLDLLHGQLVQRLQLLEPDTSECRGGPVSGPEQEEQNGDDGCGEKPFALLRTDDEEVEDGEHFG